LGFAQGHRWEFEREATRLVNATFNKLRQLTEMPVAGSEFTPGIADSNYWPTVEFVVWIALTFEPTAVDKTIAALGTKPSLAAPGRAGLLVHGYVTSCMPELLLRSDIKRDANHAP
jgi:hypothetical protein